MTLRVVAKGSGERRPLLLSFLVGSHMDAKLVAAMPPGSCVISDDSSNGTEKWRQILQKASAVCGPPGPVVLAGFSAGCQRVRELWRMGARPEAILLIDGTHASKPPEAWQLDSWRAILDSGKACERLVVATHTCQTYVENLPRNGPTPPFLSTWTVLRQCSGHALDQVPGQLQEGQMWIQSFPSQPPIDKEAHIYQQRVVLPNVIAGIVTPYLSRIPGSSVTERPAPAWLDPNLSYGERCLAWSRFELDAGVKEDPPGSNSGPRIRDYLAPCVRDDKLLGLRAGNWCAAAACAAHRAAALPSDSVPPYRASGAEMEADAKAAGTWADADDVLAGEYTPKPGDIVTLPRGSEAWMRHVCRVVEWRADKAQYTSIGGNEGDRWAYSVRQAKAGYFVGVIKIG